jgi:uncharacterized membrane protein
MAELSESIEVDVPISTAYNQWTQFEDFPEFMDNVTSVKQIDDTHVHWVAEIGGKKHEWDAEITFQEPDRQITWRAVDGKTNVGFVKFERIGDERTRVKVRMTWDPDGPVEAVGEKVGADDRGVRTDLKRFKELVERRRQETGAWRGEVRGGEVTS